jgi:hypothetical protein
MIKTSHYYKCDTCASTQEADTVDGWLCLSLIRLMATHENTNKHFCSLYCLKQYLNCETEESIIECLI